MTPVNHIAVVNRSGLDDAEVAIIVEAYRAELPAFCAAWMVDQPGLAFYGKDHEQAISDEACLFFVDSANEPDAFGYHTALGKAIFGYIDLNICRAYHEDPARVFGHELFELIADPDCDRWAGPMRDGSHVAIEVCDPVQRFSAAREVDDPVLGKGSVEIADYVLPVWFDESSGSQPKSAQGAKLHPLEDADGGYHLSERDGKLLGASSVRRGGRTVRRMARGR